MLTAEKTSAPLFGIDRPRLAPPIPARSKVKDYEATARRVGIVLIPWQRIVGRYLYATAAGDQWLYPEVAAIVSRQNGKTRLLKPHIIERLRMNRRILHTAQTRELPRKQFFDLLPAIEAEFPTAKIRRGAGQETIELQTGGFYTISAATGGGPRGLSIDDLLVDEVREIDEDFIAAAIPTMMASANPQVLYLSNAGSEESVALNAIRARREEDPALAYLEWSAPPELAADDEAGWAQANPSLGHFPMIYDNLVRSYRSHRLAGTMAHFETENLCRWVVTTRERLVDDFSWTACRVGVIGKPVMPAALGVSMDPGGTRASVVMAWRAGDVIAIRLLADVRGDPVDLEAIGEIVKRYPMPVGFDPMTDAALAKYAGKRAESIAGAKYANATAQFVNAVNGQRLRWAPESQAISDDLTWTATKPDGDPGHFHAVRAKDDHPVPAALATIRAVWLASEPTTSGRARVY